MMTPFEHISSQLDEGIRNEADLIKCDIEELASILNELKELRSKVNYSYKNGDKIGRADAYGKANALIRVRLIESMNLEYESPGATVPKEKIIECINKLIEDLEQLQKGKEEDE